LDLELKYKKGVALSSYNSLSLSLNINSVVISTNGFERRIGFYLKKDIKKTPTNMEGVFKVFVNKYYIIST